MARFLCLPLPCCASRVGEELGERNLMVDPRRVLYCQT